MKTLLATTAAIVLASSSAFASSDMNDEFYDGLENSSIVTAATSLNSNLHSEGNFVNIDLEASSLNGVEIGSASNDANLHTEGNYDV